jgi:NADH:ubiquinone oxidoreductase subunit F (NADH-binding)
MTLLASYAILGTLLVFIITKAVDNAHVIEEGTGWLERVLHRIENGRTLEEEHWLLWVSKVSGRKHNLSTLGDAASWPVAAAIRHRGI